ncbi:hypothetical protein [Leptolyngbya sp. 7M]|uniref:hypothetical protein n=1 Tax=Leptolyngbya sp. 7M TaxID=2812896 RepID=UPI001B8CEC72|nr:hypothetical protein [Leptolyngbya sp. 7M]QYO66268.1 hypothetical protein JVX88_05565 [Leptolyngbya sp. 7M]
MLTRASRVGYICQRGILFGFFDQAGRRPSTMALRIVIESSEVPDTFSEACSKVKIASIIAIVLGALGSVLGLLVLGISLALPELTSGKTSWDEAMLGIIPGAILMVLSFLLFVIGVVVFFVARKKKPH